MASISRPNRNHYCHRCRPFEKSILVFCSASDSLCVWAGLPFLFKAWFLSSFSNMANWQNDKKDKTGRLAMNFFNVSQIRITAYSVEYSKVNRNTITSIVHNNFPFFSSLSELCFSWIPVPDFFFFFSLSQVLGLWSQKASNQDNRCNFAMETEFEICLRLCVFPWLLDGGF